MDLSKDELIARIRALELENQQLKEQNGCYISTKTSEVLQSGLSLEEYRRYGRQMIVPHFGALQAQTKLKSSSILVVGAGGLGCPALLYLAAAGIGSIGIVDHDTVDLSNLHRQVLHTTDSVGMLKCESAKKYLNKLNPNVSIETYPHRLEPQNAFDIVQRYDVVLDCTDAPAIRYLINDVAVICGKTIVSGSGLKTDGQVSVLNFDRMGPCYRCFYPQPPSPELITSCSDGGVIGPIIGLVGVSMAVETIKVLTGFYKDNFQPFLALYSGYPAQQLRTFKMRGRQKNCKVCGEKPEVTRESIELGTIDYKAFCGSVGFTPIDKEYRVLATDFASMDRPLVIDVRPKEQFAVAALKDSINVPWDEMRKLERWDEVLERVNRDTTESQVVFVCRYGNDSQLAVQKALDLGYSDVKDIVGGLNKWSENVDKTFPKY